MQIQLIFLNTTCMWYYRSLLLSYACSILTPYMSQRRVNYNGHLQWSFIALIYIYVYKFKCQPIRNHTIIKYTKKTIIVELL